MSPLQGRRLTIHGTVQGVGFRPFIWRLANTNNIVGRVWNDGAGVVIEAWGEAERLTAFVAQIEESVPPLAQITEVEACEIIGAKTVPESFQIVTSRGGEITTAISPDAATCPDCLAELFEPNNRRYRYPFTNCTHCGPRFSIVQAIPYDRASTSMSLFAICPNCEAEYRDPANRRFHTQAICCPECGPRLWVESGGERIESEVIELSATLIGQGKILAIKGIGGFHLVCDATNARAIEQLRQGKQRPDKPFALMGRDLAMVREYAEVSEMEAEQLTSIAAPVVLLKQKRQQLPEALAPSLNTLGFMLPYTPLHHLLLAMLQRPLVMTSANRSGEPLVSDNDEARECLSAIADSFLMHDREIVNRLDDSVVRVINGRSRVMRRARGYVPRPSKLPPELKNNRKILAMGAEMKGSFSLLKDGEAITSQYIGDLKGAETCRHYRDTIEHYLKHHNFVPGLIVIDKHHDYLSSQYGRELAARLNTPVIEMQHHHAHIASVMAEYDQDMGRKVVGVALDGIGYGDDGTLWGGEFMMADYRGYQRLAHFEAVAMPGGQQAIIEPWRSTFAHLDHAIGWQKVVDEYGEIELIHYLKEKPIAVLKQMMERRINTPLASSAGRLFDAVAVALGLCREPISYDGEAAIKLESLALPHSDRCGEGYGYRFQQGVIGWQPMWPGVLDDLRSGTAAGVIAARVHHTVARAVTDVADCLCRDNAIDTVVLSGGVFQNAILLTTCSTMLEERGLRVLSPSTIPANDGGIALGQAIIGASINH
ncbi:MAG: carbamoyltransferase HypF [Chromatiales bacterium]|nr:carbamoyltransferase HypF [Chromatiales bacterium]